MKKFRSALTFSVLLAATGLAACQDAATASPEPYHARYAVRGRWPGERLISYRIDSADGPVAAAVLHGAIEAALETWASTGCVRFRPAGSGETPDLVLSWSRGPHEACTALGTDPCIAHAGPVGPGTYVQFDAERDWSGAFALRQAALHEVGHVLGLDHTDDPDSVMHPDPATRRAWLGRADHAAIQALYGSRLQPRDGDLVVQDPLDEVLLVLPMVAPGSLTAWTLADVDGDGDDELLVRRNDAASAGATWVFHFAPGPVLERVDGPMSDIVVRLSGLGSVGVGDLDGDGRVERVGRAR